ncbi:MAG: flagellin [Asticcacaulis sp.]
MRISTSQSWSNALSNLMAAQDRQNSANTQLSTQKVATDLMGYGRSSEVIAAYQASMTRTDAYIDVTSTVSSRLDSQDLALNTTADSLTAAKDSILGALANGNGTTLMLDLQGTFSSALSGLNFQHNGQFLFAGGSNQGAPVAVNSLSQLGALASASDAFTNGNVKKSSQIDANTTIQTGMLASDLGTELMGLYKDIQNYNDDPATGPFGDSLTDAQKTYLTTKGQEFSTVYNKMLQQVSLNGTMQKRVENTQSSLQNQSDSLSQMIQDKTGADMAKAYTDLQQAQVAVQASAQVLAGLTSTSLLNLLK